MTELLFHLPTVSAASTSSGVQHWHVTFLQNNLQQGFTVPNQVCLPHMMMSAGITIFPTVLAAHFATPLHRELALAHRARSCSRRALTTVLSGKPGNAAFLIIGGAPEALLSYPGTYELVRCATITCVVDSSGAFLAIDLNLCGDTNTTKITWGDSSCSGC